MIQTYEDIKKHAVRAGHAMMCAPIAVSLLTGVDFDIVHHRMMGLGVRQSKKSGTSHRGYVVTAKALGFKVVSIPIPKKAKTNITLEGKLDPNKKYFVEYRTHVAAYLEGGIQDWSVGTRKRIRAIFEVVVDK